VKTGREVWAIVPTRSGSTGLPEKNIREIAGRPLLHYMLTTALAARNLTRVMLTTDSDRTAEVAEQISGVEVMKHDPAFSVSGQPSFGVFQYTLKKCLEKSSVKPEAVALLRVTTPLCLSSDIDNAIELLLSKRGQATSVLSVVKSDVHPKRVYAIDKEGVLHSREESPERDFPLPRQVFDDVYIRNGAIYSALPDVVLKGSLWGEKPLPYIMPKDRSININDEVDFILAEQLLKMLL